MVGCFKQRVPLYGCKFEKFHFDGDVCYLFRTIVANGAERNCNLFKFNVVGICNAFVRQPGLVGSVAINDGHVETM